MKVEYKGCIIDVQKHQNGALFYRVSDGSNDISSGFEFEEQNIDTLIEHLKSTVEDYIRDPQAYSMSGYEFEDDRPPNDYDEPEEIYDEEPAEETE